MRTPPFINRDKPLSPLSGFRSGGAARFFLETENFGHLKEAIEWSQSMDLGVFFLGSGTNILFPDADLDLLVIRWAQKGIEITNQEELVVGAGEDLQKLVNFSLEQGVLNYAWAAGLPGTVGAAVRGNVGAFGGDICQVFLKAHYVSVDDPGRILQLDRDAMKFAYRSSLVKDQGLLVLKSWFKISRGSEADMQNEKAKAAQYRSFRESRHPLDYPNCGSVFKNIDDPDTVSRLVHKMPEWEQMSREKWYGKIPAAAIIEAANLKGLKCGNAAISEKHSNFIINRGGASSDDILRVIRTTQAKIVDRFGITLIPEIQILIKDNETVEALEEK